MLRSFAGWRTLAGMGDGMRLGHFLRYHRLRQDPHLSLRTLAYQLGLSAPFVSDVELDRRTPRPDMLAVWCTALDVDPVEAERLAGRVPNDITEWLLAEHGRFAEVRELMRAKTAKPTHGWTEPTTKSKRSGR